MVVEVLLVLVVELGCHLLCYLLQQAEHKWQVGGWMGWKGWDGRCGVAGGGGR